MKTKNDNIVGKSVKYYDYVGDERFGTIVAIEPSCFGEYIPYCYIEDDDPSYNIHTELIINGIVKRYAEIRLSTEVYIDE